MEVRDQLKADLKTAMREGDTTTRDVLRMMMAAIKQVEVDQRIELDNDGVMAVLTKQSKRRRESIAEFEKAGRDDLIAKEQSDLVVIDKYLPKMLSHEEVTAVVAPVVTELGVSDMKDMGRVMGKVMPLLKGKADGKVVNQVVRELIQAQA